MTTPPGKADKKSADLPGELGTEAIFGYEWNIYRKIIPLHKKQFLGWIQPIDLSFFRGKRFLDAGCGIGRNSLWPLEAEAASAVAFDFDQRTVAVAKENLKEYSQCEVLYRSIYDIPFNNEFDVTFCIGVIHHLERPREAVEKLVGSLKPGGTLILWIYAYEGNERYLKWFDPLRQYISSRLPPRWTLILSAILTAILRLYLLFPWRAPYYRLLKERSFRHTEALIFDQLLPHIALYLRKEEVMELVAGLPVAVRHLTHTNGVSWTLVAEKKS